MGFTGIQPRNRSGNVGPQSSPIDSLIIDNTEAYNKVQEDFNNLDRESLKLERQDANIEELNVNSFMNSQISIMEPLDLFKAALCAAHSSYK